MCSCNPVHALLCMHVATRGVGLSKNGPGQRPLSHSAHRLQNKRGAKKLITGADQVTEASNDHQFLQLHAATACTDAPVCFLVSTDSDIVCSGTMRLTCHTWNYNKPGHGWQTLILLHLKAENSLIVPYEWAQQEEECQMAVSLRLRLLDI